ncbi:MAG: polysaccharide biosynthesis tyrosine autokinase [Actinomycetia bacterium]|nr:polysaccharide biosynthesis tyrosine autokinase [Actinomycetes bacterium]
MSLLQPMRYASSTEMFVSTSTGDDATGLVQGVNYTQNQVLTYAEVMTHPIVLNPVIEELGLETTPSELSADLSANVSFGTVLLRLTAYAETPQGAAHLADAVAEQFTETIQDLESVGNSPSPVEVTITSPAQVSGTPVSPRPLRYVILGLLAGGLIGLVVSVVRVVTNTRIVDATTLPTGASLPPLIGTIGYDRKAEKSPLLTQADAQHPRAEAFRALRTNLRFIDPENPPRVIITTSSVPHEGKSTTTANLALALAADGSRVLLIEADLRRPKLLDYLGLTGSVGLTTILIGDAELDDVVQHYGREWTIDVLGAGDIPPNPSELLGSPRMTDLIDSIRDRYEFVIIDTPPLLPVTDAAVLASRADGTIVVVGSGVARKAQLLTALSSLQSVSARVLGLVLNKVPVKTANGSYYGSYTAQPSASSSVRRDDESGSAHRDEDTRLDGDGEDAAAESDESRAQVVMSRAELKRAAAN